MDLSASPLFLRGRALRPERFSARGQRSPGGSAAPPGDRFLGASEAPTRAD
jgi:hypothetical protein